MTPDQAPAASSEALVALRYVLDVAARRLSRLKRVAMIAACPNTNDDMGRFVDWLGVQVGGATWERTETRTVTEEARDTHGLATAREVLDWLQDADWRPLVERALGLSLFNEVLAVIVQHEATWFVVSASNDGEEIAFLLGPSGALTRVGTPERLDQRLGRSRPLLLERITPAAWPTLRDAVPAFPVRRPSTAGTVETLRADKLATLLHQAISRLSPLPDSVRYAANAPSDPQGPAYAMNAWRTVAVNKNAASIDAGSIASWGNKDWYANRLRQDGGAAGALNDMLDTLEQGKWRDLFVQAVMPLDSNEPLGVLLRGSEWWLIASQTAVFAPAAAGGFELVGACDRILSGHDVAAARLHLFDGTSLALMDGAELPS